ncbi:MAG: hypothetical protein IJA60_05245 [Clostridia bacterium]|nr:hypothetical protein [Clostridia bacterium]
MRPYEALANAIVEKAAEDYRTALKYSYMHPGDRKYSEDVSNIEKFFNSPWYALLTNLDADFLMENIKVRVRREVRV